MTPSEKPCSTPSHVGIIMDGNGRWAQKRGLPRKMGHRQGAKAMDACIQSCAKLGVPYVSFFAFSTENWKRPKEEVDALMEMLESYLNDFLKRTDETVRLRFTGDLRVFSAALREKMRNAEEKAKENVGTTVSVCLNYGGRNEILHAAALFAKEVSQGKAVLESLTEETFEKYLFTAGIPDVDLIIRPSGEKRLSNFMLWQSAYAEFVFMDVLWPDFKLKHLKSALDEYAERSRRFGGV